VANGRGGNDGTPKRTELSAIRAFVRAKYFIRPRVYRRAYDECAARFQIKIDTKNKTTARVRCAGRAYTTGLYRRRAFRNNNNNNNDNYSLPERYR